MKTKKISFSHSDAVFGLDIGHSSLKVMQIDSSDKNGKPKVLGYGLATYQPESINNGVIINTEALAKAMRDLFSNNLVGVIEPQKVAATVPTSRTFSRQMNLPPMEDKDLAEAVRLEAEQYIPLHPNELYIDFEVTNRTAQGLSLMIVAVPKNIVDSYIRLLESMKLDPVIIEPTINAAARLFKLANAGNNQISILIDFGSISTDLAVINKTVSVVSTVQGGSNNLTALIAKQLGISTDEAFNAKNEYGLSYSNKRGQIKEAVEPVLSLLVKEVQKIIRYYEERMGHLEGKIGQIVIIGGGATMPGLSEYISSQLNLPTRQLDPLQKLDFAQLQPPADSDKSMYVTAAGEAIIDHGEFSHD